MPDVFADGPEIALPRGDVTEGVVRIGETVRRPRQPSSVLVAEYLQHLHAHGFDRAPRVLGTDAQGRDVLDFVDGDVPGDDLAPWAAGDDVLVSVAELLRRLHEASVGFTPPHPVLPPDRPAVTLPAGEPELFAHRDVTPGNTVCRDGRAWALIDFDLCGWTTRSIDVANTAVHWVPLAAPEDRPAALREVDVPARLRLFLAAYADLSAAAFLTAARLRFTNSAAVMRWNAEHLGGGWARMWREGAGDRIARRIAWFDAVRDELADALA